MQFFTEIREFQGHSQGNFFLPSAMSVMRAKKKSSFRLWSLLSHSAVSFSSKYSIFRLNLSKWCQEDSLLSFSIEHVCKRGQQRKWSRLWNYFRKNTTSPNVCVIAGFLERTTYCRLAAIHLNWVPHTREWKIWFSWGLVPKFTENRALDKMYDTNHRKSAI